MSKYSQNNNMNFNKGNNISGKTSVARVPGVILAIPRDELGNSSVIDLIKFEVENAAILTVKKRKRYLIALTISGYNADPRELFEIPEVCNWTRSIFTLIPSFFYFLTIDCQRRFVGWLCGPVVKTKVNSAVFTECLDTQLMTCVVNGVVQGEELLMKQGADRLLIDEFRKYDVVRTTLTREIPVKE